MDDETRALGGVKFASDRLKRDLSTASNQGADNLLFKALAQLLQNDEEQARGFVRRALSLPFDPFEEQDPAPWSAHMMLFISISDDLGSGEAGDSGWLDRAEAVLEASGPYADREVRACLQAFATDAQLLSPEEKERLAKLTSVAPEPALTPADETTRIDAIIEVLGPSTAIRCWSGRVRRPRPGDRGREAGTWPLNLRLRTFRVSGHLRTICRTPPPDNGVR